MTISLPANSSESTASTKLGLKLASDENDASVAYSALFLEPSVENNDAERAQAILDGKEPPARRNRETMLDALHSRVIDIRGARELHAKQDAVIQKREQTRVVQAVQPAVDAEYRKAAESAVNLLKSLREIESVESQLRTRGFGVYPRPCPVDARDALTVIEDLLRELRNHGYSKGSII